jgi:hypothetical protein
MENQVQLCDYGCGQEAKYKIKYGGFCCEEKFQRCPNTKKFRKEHPNKKHSKPYIKKQTTEKPEFCDYGCGDKAKFYLKTVNKWCCSKSFNNCRSSRIKRSKSLKNNYIESKFDNINNVLCDYGCGNIAKYRFKNGKVCCNKVSSVCIKSNKNIYKWREKIKIDNQEIKVVKKKKESSTLIENSKNFCEFGCNQIGKYKLRSGKFCCESSHLYCLGFKKKISERMKLNNPMKNPETVKKNFLNHNRKKTGPEKYVEKIFNELNLEVQYIGDGKKYINGRSPDFLIPGTKKLIEVYDSSFNYCGKIRDKDWEEKRKKQLYGYQILFLDFYKIGGIQNYEKLVNIIQEFYFK